MKKLGIIGGLGPEITSEFYLDVIFTCQKNNSITRAPIIISSVPLPYEIEKDLIEKNFGAKRLEKSGANFLVMPCNSLHLFIEDIRKAVEIPILSILEETVKFLNENNFKRVGIISTSATIENKLYENILEKNGINYVIPDDFQQAKMGKIIGNLVSGMHNNKDREHIKKSSMNLMIKM